MADTELPSKDSSFVYKVNGVQLSSKDQVVLGSKILASAAAAGAMPGKPDEYELQGDKGRYGPSDSVDLEQDNIFITIPITPTPVALE